MLTVLFVAIGGAAGAMARYGLSYIVSQKIKMIFPWGTFWVNIIGCFFIGIVFELSERSTISSHTRALIAVGFLGSFTTFSTFTLETVNLMRGHELLLALANIGLSIISGLGACILGILCMRTIFKLM